MFEVGLAPVVTFNHFTSPHWFAMRGTLARRRRHRELFARYCDRVMERFGDHIAVAVTMNEPNLARLLTWIGLPAFVHDLERATLEAASAATGVPAYRLSNVMLPEEMDAFADGMTAGHIAGEAAIKAHRPELPVGLSLAIVDDVVVGDDSSVRDRKRAEVYDRWLRARPRGRLHRGAELRADPVRRLRRRTAAGRNAAQPDGQRGRAARHWPAPSATPTRSRRYRS